MKDIIESVTRGLSSSVAFYFGNPSENNLITEDTESDIIGLLLPYDKESEERKVGIIEDKYHLNILFLKRSELDLDFGTRYDNYLNPMEGLADEFYVKLKRYMEGYLNPRPHNQISNKKVYLDQINLFDVNYDGVLLILDVPKSPDLSYCQHNYIETISSDGSSVTNNLTWLHTIDEVSADGVIYGASASYSTSGYTLDINAGAAKTGSYTFTPIVNANYSFVKDLWVKWSDGVKTLMRIKVDYTYNA